MKQYLKSLLACALGLTMAFSYAAAQNNNNAEDNQAPKQDTPAVTEQEATALRNQYADANELNKQIAALIADAPNMSQAKFEEQMSKLLGQANKLSDKMKRNPATEDQQAILARTITAAQNTLDGLKSGTMTKDQAIAAVRKLRAPLHNTLVGIATFLRTNGYGKLLAAYIKSLKSPDNSQISPEV